MLFANVTIRLLSSDDFQQDAKDAAARDLTQPAAQSALSIPIVEVMPLAHIAAAHDSSNREQLPGEYCSRFPRR